jgi:hypothetical protein
MSTENIGKINQLPHIAPPGTVLQASWLVEKGYSLDLQKRYRRSKWLSSIGTGAMVRVGDTVGYEGAIYALQQQSGFTIHPAGRTALSLLGRTHYLTLAEKKVTLFGGANERLPAWFRQHDWNVTIDYHASSFLPKGEGLMEISRGTFSIKVSNTARAVMEGLYLAPEGQDLLECYQQLENLNDLRPSSVQQLLEKCESIKVKRLFLYMAEKTGHAWFQHLDVKNIDVGKGKRSIVKNGVYVAKYQITVPKELEENDKAIL